MVLPAVGRMHQFPHLGNRNHRQQLGKQQEAEEEQADRSRQRGVVPKRRVIHAPACWHEIAVQADDDDHESLGPHPDLDNERDQKHEPDILPNFAEPEELRGEDVAEHQQPERTSGRGRKRG